MVICFRPCVVSTNHTSNDSQRLSGKVTEQHEIQVIPSRDKTRPASLPSILQRTETERKKKNSQMLGLCKVVSLKETWDLIALTWAISLHSGAVYVHMTTQVYLSETSGNWNHFLHTKTSIASSFHVAFACSSLDIVYLLTSRHWLWLLSLV